MNKLYYYPLKKFTYREKLGNIVDLVKFVRRRDHIEAELTIERLNNLISIGRKYLPGDLKKKALLEVGCGQRHQCTLVLNSMGFRNIIGCDLNPYNFNFRMLWEEGWGRFIKSFFRALLFDGRYYKYLENAAHVKLKKGRVKLQKANISDLPYPEDSIDFIFSFWVFEHVDDVLKGYKEIYKVLKPNGIAYFAIHLYYSLSGGHNLNWVAPENNPPSNVEPWDHLRKKVYPAHTYLNRLAKKNHIDISKKVGFEILEISTKKEGGSFLTEEIKEELKDYNVEDLLTRDLHLVLRKP